MKVIFISGYAEDAFRKRLDSDADIHFLPKPFSLKQLAGKVKQPRWRPRRAIGCTSCSATRRDCTSSSIRCWTSPASKPGVWRLRTSRRICRH